MTPLILIESFVFNGFEFNFKKIKMNGLKIFRQLEKATLTDLYKFIELGREINLIGNLALKKREIHGEVNGIKGVKGKDQRKPVIRHLEAQAKLLDVDIEKIS